MRRAPPLLLLLLLAAAAASEPPQVLADESIDTLISNDTIVVDNQNGTLTLRDVNGTVIELDGNPEEVVRKKRTFGDIVFRGLADVLGYSVARKPPQADFPPPLAPVPGIDAPLAGAAPAAPAAPAPAPPPCGQPRAAGPPPCRAAKPPPPPPPPQPKAVPPCPRPRAAPRPKPKPTPPPPPPPPPPCAQPRANPTTPAPCTPPPPPPPPPKADNLERITSNLRLNFNFNRAPVSLATQAPPAAAEEVIENEQAEIDNQQEQFVPIAIEPRAAKLPQTEPRQPRVYVDAFVVRNGVARRVDTVDAKQFNTQRANNADEDYLAYDDDAVQQQLDDDDYEDVQESRDREAAVRQFGNAVDQFWQNKKKQRNPAQQKEQRLPANHYQNVHFGDRDLANDVRRHGESHQSLQRERPRANRIPVPQPLPEADDDTEVTTTTEDPRKPLKPRVLPPTEHNPNQIDTVTVRVPPIYREKRPRKLHRERPEHPDRDEEEHEDTDRRQEHRDRESREFSSREQEREREYEQDADGDDSSLAPQTERPARRRRRRKQNRKARAVDKEYYTAGDYDYYGNKQPVSKEEQFYMELTVPPPTLDADVARHEKPVDSGYFLEDHERLREDPSHRIREDNKSGDAERADDKERSAEDKERSAEDKERSSEEKERAGEEDRADSLERTDKLSPNARVRESGYRSNYVRATNVQVDDPHPAAHTTPTSTGQA